MIFLHIFLQFFKKPSYSTQIHIHSHRDLNSVSSSTDFIKRLGPIPSSWRIPAPRVDLRRAVASSSGGNTSQSVKPTVLNSLELIIIATGICEESTFSVGSHSSNVRPDGRSGEFFCCSFTHLPLRTSSRSQMHLFQPLEPTCSAHAGIT